MCGSSPPRVVRRERIPKAKCLSHITESSFRCPPAIQAGFRALWLMNPTSPLVRRFLCEACHYCWQHARFTIESLSWFRVKLLLNIYLLHPQGFMQPYLPFKSVFITLKFECSHDFICCVDKKLYSLQYYMLQNIWGKTEKVKFLP